ncbi:MAG TPA: glycine cleavage system protein GcvH [Planctomycetes bacterium]|nr:glycine cleavage system protein GcvH [Planctomycetota bacterium]
MSDVPQDRKYLPSHEWAHSVDGLVVVGISEFASQELGELVFIELPKEGSNVQFDGAFGEIESVKAVSELTSPVTGKVIEVNQSLIDNQQAISESPYDKGWMMKVEPDEDSGIEKLLDAAAYQSQLSKS